MPQSNEILISLNLSEPDSVLNRSIGKIIEGRLASQGRAKDECIPDLFDFWNPEFFGLHKVRLFQQASEETRQQILDGCARTLLTEAYFIEKSGMSYCAKMILLADTAQVEQVYGLIAADEATHLQWIRPYVHAPQRQRPEGALLRFLTGLIEQCESNTLAYLVQVILEGWGLHHYKTLSKSCRHAQLRDICHSIYKDEALHHHAGEVVFDVGRVTSEQSSLILDSLHGYTEMVRVGPQAVVNVLSETLGGLNKAERTTIFSELETEKTSAEKLVLLRNLMSGTGREHYVADLEAKGAFTPSAPAACAAILD